MIAKLIEKYAHEHAQQTLMRVQLFYDDLNDFNKVLLRQRYYEDWTDEELDMYCSMKAENLLLALRGVRNTDRSIYEDLVRVHKNVIRIAVKVYRESKKGA